MKNESERITISFDRPKRIRLEQRIKQAQERGEESFLFEGNEFLTRYAEYLVEYLKMSGI